MKQVFIAIRLPILPETYSNLLRAKDLLKFMKIRWVEPNYLHLTLKYVGQANNDLIESIKKVINEVFSEVESFSVNINKCGIFGSSYAPRILWWGIKEEELLSEMVLPLWKALEELGIEIENQSFVPHITIGRIVKVNSLKLFQKQLPLLQDFQPISFSVERIDLIESIIGTKGPRYNEIFSYSLIKTTDNPSSKKFNIIGA